MILFHENGKMNGDVLEGKYINAKLNDLSLDQMLELQKECSKDPDSLSLLEAFLDREYANWRDKIESNSDTSIITSSFMNERQAEEILGLTKEATREQIIQAHRKLMQKLHPDRGGSTFLAAKVNEAKSVLLRKIIK
ncbi:MAG: DnaJ domain-containing protein [Candidatus Azotimanducaceae bacterium]